MNTQIKLKKKHKKVATQLKKLLPLRAGWIKENKRQTKSVLILWQIFHNSQ